MKAAGTLGVVLVVALCAAAAGAWWARRDAARVEPERRGEPAPLASVRREAPPAAPAAAPAPEAPRSTSSGSRLGVLNDEAIAALEARAFDRAVELFEQCHTGAPDENVFRGNLAEALVRRAVEMHERVRPCESCVADLARAVALAPEREGLAALLARWRAELETEQEFLRDRSVHFELSYDGWRQSLLDAAPDVLAELELHCAELSLVFGLWPGENGAKRIPVVLYRREEFARVTGLAEWAGGSFDGTIRVPIAEGRALDSALSALLRHELVHAFVREASGGDRVPAWLNEGLAQWLARDPSSELASARQRMAGRELIPLEKLERPFASLSEPEIPFAYAQSLLFTSFLERAHGRDSLLAMVRGPRGGERVAAAFESWTRVPLALAFEDFAAQPAR
ncbi:MAG: hypothetical protein FJ298_11720 [Planctomycetes bacterium]|nr:hypothetical protein [Planctomycetota bacterium]